MFHSGRDIFSVSKKNFASRPAWGYEFWKPQNAFSTPLAFKVHFCYRFTPKPLFSTPQAFKGCFYAMFGDNFACEICFSSFVLDMRLSNCAFEFCFCFLLCNSAFEFCFWILLFNSALQFCFWILRCNSAFQFCFAILLLNSGLQFCFAILLLNSASNNRRYRGSLFGL